MQLPILLLTCALALLALAYVLYPLYRHRLAKPNLVASQAVGQSSPADSEQAARLSLQEVELDYQLGNIAESDYRSLRERYMRRAIIAMKARHANTADVRIESEHELSNEQESDIDRMIEEQLRNMREFRGDVGGNEDNNDE